MNSPWNAIGSQCWLSVVDAVDADRVVADERSASDTIASPMPMTSWIRLSRDDSSWIARRRAAPRGRVLNRRAFATAIAIWFANVAHSSSSSGDQSYGLRWYRTRSPTASSRNTSGTKLILRKPARR